MTVVTTVDLIKSSVETAAIAVGGLWTAWTFHKLQSVRASDAEINRNIAESRESERRLLSEQPNLDIAFSDVSEFRPANNLSAFLKISVAVKNSGLRNLQVVFHKASLSVARLERHDTSSKEIVDIRRMPPYWLPETGSKLEVMPSRIFRTGQSRTIVFLVPISGAGTYLVQFQAPYASLPFEGELVDEEEASLWINAVEQRLVTVHDSSE